MTTQDEIRKDSKYIPVLDFGFVGLVDYMGSDDDIDKAARVSYGKGTRAVTETRTLIRYMFRHHHTSPVEMCETKYHVKMPIVALRQLIRHRTHSMNEYSGRYSEMTDEFYIPAYSVIQPQSTDNKQGRGGELSHKARSDVRETMRKSNRQAYETYQALLGKKFLIGSELSPAVNDPDDPLFDKEFPGIARELARLGLPLSTYTEFYWKQNLHNLFHMLGLRLDLHAQYEIRVFAEAMYKLIQPIFPIACEAFEDYHRHAIHLSRMEKNLTRDVLKMSNAWETFLQAHSVMLGIEDPVKLRDAIADKYGMGKREMSEFSANLLTPPTIETKDEVK